MFRVPFAQSLIKLFTNNAPHLGVVPPPVIHKHKVPQRRMDRALGPNSYSEQDGKKGAELIARLQARLDAPLPPDPIVIGDFGQHEVSVDELAKRHFNELASAPKASSFDLDPRSLVSSELFPSKPLAKPVRNTKRMTRTVVKR